jgi:hypothetical protein
MIVVAGVIGPAGAANFGTLPASSWRIVMVQQKMQGETSAWG